MRPFWTQINQSIKLPFKNFIFWILFFYKMHRINTTNATNPKKIQKQPLLKSCPSIPREKSSNVRTALPAKHKTPIIITPNKIIKAIPISGYPLRHYYTIKNHPDNPSLSL